MIIQQDKYDKYLKFLNDYKIYVGLSDWNIKLKIKTISRADAYAEVETEQLEKDIIVGLTAGFFRLGEKRQTNILLHELIHARVNIYTEELEKKQEVLEEDMVNDLTRGFERFGELKFR